MKFKKVLSVVLISTMILSLSSLTYGNEMPTQDYQVDSIQETVDTDNFDALEADDENILPEENANVPEAKADDSALPEESVDAIKAKVDDDILPEGIQTINDISNLIDFQNNNLELINIEFKNETNLIKAERSLRTESIGKEPQFSEINLDENSPLSRAVGNSTPSTAIYLTSSNLNKRTSDTLQGLDS